VTVLAAFSAAWLACVAPTAKPSVSAPVVPGPSLRFIGRFDTHDPSHPRFAWSASAVAARIVGATVHVHLKDTGYDELQVAVDGEPVRVLSVNPSREDYEVATGLLEGAHDVVPSRIAASSSSATRSPRAMATRGTASRAPVTRRRSRTSTPRTEPSRRALWAPTT